MSHRTGPAAAGLLLSVVLLLGTFFENALAQSNAKHLELIAVPTADKVYPETSVPDVVGGNELLGREERMNERSVYGREDRNPLRRRQ